jgi:hypothetical protein
VRRAIAKATLLTLLRGRRVESSPLLFDFLAAAFGALDPALIVFGNCQNQRKLLLTGLASIIVMGHGLLLQQKVEAIKF